MSTRHAQPGGEFASEKFASSAEFERGLIGSLVARRCSVLDDPKDKELIWFIHFLSWKVGLKAIAQTLLESYLEQLGTPEMVKLGKRAGQSYSAEQVRKIRGELLEDHQGDFLLTGEMDREARREIRMGQEAKAARMRRRAECEAMCVPCDREDHIERDLDRREKDERAKAEKRPAHYPVESFLSLCRQQAKDHLESFIQNLCLNPAIEIENAAPWYFAGIIEALRSYYAQWIAERAEALVTTAIGKEIEETLEYTAYSRTLTLVEGGARIGKSFAARSWCETHPGHARFIEVPTGNDDVGFFRALARGLGIGNFAQYKAVEIRERVESVLLTGDLLLCLDEAHRLWPQHRERRAAYPKRINWLMSMANQGVPICCISTPQFIHELKTEEKEVHWNSAQLQGRLGLYKPLPNQLSMGDLTEVAAAQLPEADAKTLRALADYARTSARYLAAIETISKRARFIASRAGRDSANADDVRRAMQESVIPSDSQLVRALENRPAGRKRLPVPANSSADASAPRRPGIERDPEREINFMADNQASRRPILDSHRPQAADCSRAAGTVQ